MQRLLTLVFVLCLAVPAGISISGCTRNPAGNYCNGLGYGLKLTDVASIDLEPRTTGISMAFGQIQQIATPTAKTCKGTSATVAGYTYGTTNNQLVDISPSGNICAGTWNRRSGGGIPDYTICNAPNPQPSTNGLPYANAAITATASGISSNQVTVYVHPQITSFNLELEYNGTTGYQGCLSQTQTAQLDSQAFYSQSVNGVPTQTLICAPAGTTALPNIPSCSTALGNLTYTSSNTSIASIDQFGVITAALPGTSFITASVSGDASSAGHFSTCPPANISVTLNGSTSGTVTQGVTQNLVTTITDTKGATIQGLTLDYQSTNPLDISVGTGGAVTANFAGAADIYAVCQPTTCNPAPINEVGVNQTGTSITSNSVKITTPGIASDYVWLASPQSQYFIPIELVTGTLGSTVRMPYIPNSMVMDRTGTNLYFGSSHELMIYATATNTLAKEDANVPGVVLAAAPNNQTILINDPIRQIFYIYSPSGSTYTTFSGVGNYAQWTPDSKTLYIVGNSYSTVNGVSVATPTLFVNNVNTGWTTYPLPVNSNNLAITIPSVGAFLGGTTTVAHAWCPTISAGTAGQTNLLSAYPQAATVPLETDVLGATIDGQHIIGASVDGITGTAELTDIGLDIFASLDSGACPPSGSGITFNLPAPAQTALTGVDATAIDQVVTSPGSDLTFITYTGTDASTGILPYYTPSTTPITAGTTATPAGTLNTSLQLSGATAPVAGAFSLDGTIFFVSTSGDNKVHYINVTGATPTDTQQISPGLPCTAGNAITVNPCTPGSPVPATFIAVKPRTTT